MVRFVCWLLIGVAVTLPHVLAEQPDAPKQDSVEMTELKQDSDAGQTLSTLEYRAQNAAMQALVEHCRASAKACDGSELATRMTVARAGTHGVFLREDWLVAALATAKTQPDADRAALMAQAADRLREEAAELATDPAPVAGLDKARRDADQILARREFQYVQQETWWTRRWARIMLSLSKFFGNVFGNMPTAPWAVPLVEGGVLLAMSVGLVLWAWRTTQQQRVALSTSISVSNAGWQRESDDWAKKAEAEAAAGAWREAVHCLYWAAIVMLEGRRLWRANRARTPREYLPLFETGSPILTTLSGLTRIFEGIWYGLRPASQADYEQAQALLETLKAN